MEWKVPLYRIYHDEEDKKAVDTVIERGMHWANGPENVEIEKRLSEYVDSKFALAFNNGTSALHALLLAHEIGKGHEVIVPSFTFISTANAVLFTGAKPVFADIETKSYALEPNDVRKKITKRTKAIMPVHYGGCPAIGIEELRELCEEKGLLLIEDAAESLGAELRGKKVGAFGHSAMFSFCANKLISGGEGGAVVTKSKAIYEKLKLIRSHGRAERENYFESNKLMDYVSLGYNFRMPTIIAALVLSQLKKIDKLIKMRRGVAKEYDERLADLGVIAPLDGNGLFNVYQMYSIRVKASKRERLRRHLEAGGIMSKIYFDPVHETHFYKRVLGYRTSLPKTKEISNEILSIPMFAGMSSDEIDYVCRRIKNFLE